MGEEMFYDEMIGRWVTPSEYNEFMELLMEETQSQRDIQAGINSDLAYPEYNLRVVQETMKERAINDR